MYITVSESLTLGLLICEVIGISISAFGLIFEIIRYIGNL